VDTSWIIDGQGQHQRGTCLRARARRVRVTPAEQAGSGRTNLSFFDTLWVAAPPVQLVFLYELPTADECFPSVVRRLKESLAAALALYLPLAGRLVYVAETRDVVLDWSHSDAVGVAFTEAEGDMDVRRLAGDEAHDVPAFRSLVAGAGRPGAPGARAATRLGGGMALGVSVHHAATDGHGLWRFVDAWVSASRRQGSSVTKKSLGSPCYGREAIVHPRGDELARELLHKLAPNLPVARATDYDTRRFELARRTFYLSAQDVRSLTRLINSLASAEAEAGSGEAPPPVSTFVALSALGWTAFVRSKDLAAGEDTHLIFLADLRARLNPPVGRRLPGQLPQRVRGERGRRRPLGRAGPPARGAGDPGGGAGDGGGASGRDGDRVRRPPPSRRANVASSPHHRVHDATDFGFGKPARVELVSMNHDGEMALFGGRRDGEVQLSVSLDPGRMDAFKAHVLAACRGGGVTAGKPWAGLTRRPRL
ncbi:hypothetical protein EJB05_46014, partial [Eragrostis curvula]